MRKPPSNHGPNPVRTNRMPRIKSSIDSSSAEFKANAAHMAGLVAQLKHRRVEAGTPFLELSPLAAIGMYDEGIHGAGLITGIGRIEGRSCMILCNDATIK